MDMSQLFSRNLTTILTRVCKEEYYKSFFEDKNVSKNYNIVGG